MFTCLQRWSVMQCVTRLVSLFVFHQFHAPTKLWPLAVLKCGSLFCFLLCLFSQIPDLKELFLSSISECKKKKRLLFEIGSVNIIKLPLIFSASQDLFPTAFQHFVILKMDNYHFQFCRFLETLIVSFTGLESSHEHFSHVRRPKAVFKCDLVFTEIH